MARTCRRPTGSRPGAKSFAARCRKRSGPRSMRSWLRLNAILMVRRGRGYSSASSAFANSFDLAGTGAIQMERFELWERRWAAHRARAKHPQAAKGRQGEERAVGPAMTISPTWSKLEERWRVELTPILKSLWSYGCRRWTVRGKKG